MRNNTLQTNIGQLGLQDTLQQKGQRKALRKIIEQKGIKDVAVLQAVETIPRHFFFEPTFYNHAYEDKAFPIGSGQTISQPYTVARQTELLNVQPGMKVLEIGTGSGYQASVLCAIGARVYTIEFHENLSKKAKQLLHSMGYHPYFFVGDGSEGLKKLAPYDRILATAGAPYVPTALVEQLNPGGILVIPVGAQDSQEMVRIMKDDKGNLTQEKHGRFAFVPLVGKEGW